MFAVYKIDVFLYVQQCYQSSEVSNGQMFVSKASETTMMSREFP